MKRELNPPHVIALRLIALPLIGLGKIGAWLWDVGLPGERWTDDDSVWNTKP
jgi:hypothetical protein